MAEKGQVVEGYDDKVVVRLKRTEACEKCKACINGLTQEEMLITAINECEAEPGDWVNIEIANNKFLSAVWIMYGIPCIFLIIGFFAGSYGSQYFGYKNISDIVGFSVGLIFTVIAYQIIKFNEKKFKKNDYMPLAVEKLFLQGTTFEK